MRSMLHIIILFVAFVFLIGLYIAIKIHLKQSRMNDDEDFITRIVNKKEKQLRMMDSTMTISTYGLILVIAPLAAGIIAYIFFKSGFIALAAGAAGFYLPELFVKSANKTAQKKFEERYVRALEQMASSLRSGSSIAEAVNDVVKCRFVHMSLRYKFAKLSSDIRMSVPLAEAFMNFAEDTGSEDAKDVAIAISVQSVVGGQEADVIMDIAKSIRNRIMMRKEIKSILASSTSLVRIMDFVPLLVIGYMAITSKGYVDIYFTETKFTILFVILLILPLIGNIVNHKMLKGLKG